MLQASFQTEAGTWASSGRADGSADEGVPQTAARSLGIQNWPSCSKTSVIVMPSGLADEETALRMRRAVGFRGMAHVQDFLPMSKRDILKFEGCSLAWKQALAQAEQKVQILLSEKGETAPFAEDGVDAGDA